MKYIFRSIRWVLGLIIIFVDWITYPVKKRHPEAKQQQLDQQTAKLALYHFKMCPFCVRARRTIRKLGLNIELRDARNDPVWNEELIAQGGKYQVPCLRIEKEDGAIEWLYESREISGYLRQHFDAA